MNDFRQVSVIIPTYNEDDTITNCFESLLNGDYPVDKLEFVIADGASTDNTLETIENFSNKHPDVKIRVVDNPSRTQGYGLNIAIENIDKNSEVIVRADAHSIYPRNYIADCVRTLLTTKADNAGGVMVPVGKTPLQKAVAFCMSHPIGVGNAKFHLGNYSGFADTVYLGCFRKDIFEKAGMFDPAMTPNEDAEFNIRIRKSGGKIYLNKDIRVDYFPRETIPKLVKQYFRYGQGRCRTFGKHRAFISVRQVIPPLWTISTLVLLAMSLAWPVFIVPLLAYIFVLIAASGYGSLKKRDMAILLSPICLVIMHYAWGLGFLHQMFIRAGKEPKT
ncbi:MAG: glycosyltransferase family 2 protein [Planctomycetota bacterium]|jgi:glycosyltransferase involved in cell wall biosynthesis